MSAPKSTDLLIRLADSATSATASGSAWLSTAKDFAEFLQNVLAAAAIIVGGIWVWTLYVRRRLRYPRANLTHQITRISLSGEKVLLHVVVTVTNVGDVLIALERGETRVNRVLPLAEEHRVALDRAGDLVEPGQTDVNWVLVPGTLRRCQVPPGAWEIEPGETDRRDFDFVLDETLEMVQIYSHFLNAKKRPGLIARLFRQPKRDIGWTLATMYDLRGPSIKPPEASVARLEKHE